MRTTIRIDDALYREVKERAARSGRTVAAVLEDAVRRGLNPADRGARSPFVVQASGSGLRPGVDLASNAGVSDVMEEGDSFGAMR